MQPRFIGLDLTRQLLFAANESGDTIVPFRISTDTDRLPPAGQKIQNATPVTVAFVSASPSLAMIALTR